MIGIRFKQLAAFFGAAPGPRAAITCFRAGAAARLVMAVVTGMLIAGSLSGATAQTPAPGNLALYEVRGIEVKVSDDSAAKAKIKAILEAQQKAFATLLGRLLGEAAKDSPPEIPGEEIARVMAGLSIEKEFASAKQYSATLTVRFRPEAVQQLLDTYNLSFSAKQAPTMLLLAVYKIGDRAVLWESPNPWRDAWSALGPENSLTPILLPLGDLTDTDTISAQDVIAGRLENLDILKQRYKVNYVLVSIAEPDQTRTNLTVSLNGDSPAGLLNWKDKFAGQPGDIETTANAAAKRFLAAIEEKWRTGGPKKPASAGIAYTVTVPFSGLGEWQRIRQQISGIYGVTGIATKSLSGRGAIVDIMYDGSLGQLSRQLESQGLILADNGDSLVLYRE